MERLAMTTAGVLLAHLWAAKAVRSAVFLGAWDVTRLPAMVFASAVVVVLAVPLYARLLERFGPRRVVPVGLLVSAGGHVLEWGLSAAEPWVAVAIYLHISALGALLLSGFWSLASELFDAQSAKVGYGRIAAAGTIGGILGGLAVERISHLLPDDSALILLALFHVGGALGTLALGRRATTEPAAPSRATGPERGTIFDLGVLRSAPHVPTIALLVVLGAAGAFVIDYLFQSGAQDAFPLRADLQQFLARFYIAVGIATALVQLAAGPSVRRLGLGRTISTLPVGLGSASALALVFPTFPVVAVVRSVESALRASLFRSGYELLFVPMAPDDKRRTKTFLDVTCDRAGDAAGAILVQGVLFAAVSTTLTAFLTPTLLAVAIALAGIAFGLGRRLDRLYLGVVERRLTKHAEDTPVAVSTEAGWTVLGLTGRQLSRHARSAAGPIAPVAVRPIDDTRLAALAELRCGDRTRVRAALAALDHPDRLLIAQVTTLLAWDDVSAEARAVLEREAPRHVGLLVDALLDPVTEFAVRRRLPRVLGTVGSPRSIEGLLWSLEDERFEVRFQAARAIDRLRRHHPALGVNSDHLLRMVERELSVPTRVRRGHRLIDRIEPDDDPSSEPGAAGAGVSEQSGSLGAPGDGGQGAVRHLEHVFMLLGTIFPRDAVRAALDGVRSADPHLRGLAIEYLDNVLAPRLRASLEVLIAEATEARLDHQS